MIAKHVGDTGPDGGGQDLLTRVTWDDAEVRAEVREFVGHHLGDAEAVLVIDEKGHLKKGRHRRRAAAVFGHNREDRDQSCAWRLPISLWSQFSDLSIRSHTVVAEDLGTRLDEVGPIEFELPDVTSGERQTRSAAVLFTSSRGKLLTDTYWSELWADWREAAGWPKEGTFHSLRHFFATTLMSNGVEPQEVQKALRHANLRITLETYVHWLPKKDRPWPGR